MKINLKLDNFEGPMDLLLHLVEKQEMAIWEINISKLVDEYLIYLAEAKKENVELKVEFLFMASELLEIKALSILNKREKKEKEEDLEQRLFEYKLYKDLSETIREMENEYNIAFMKNGKSIIKPETDEIDLSDLNLSRLEKEYKQIFYKVEKEVLKVDYEKKYTTEKAMSDVKAMLKLSKKIEFSKLLGDDYNRLKIVTIFLAILELYRQNSVYIIQDREIIIEMKR